jgi:hypothetical protein
MSSSIVKCIELIYSEVGHNVISECIMRYGLDREECESWMKEMIAELSSGAVSSSSKSSKSSKSKVSKGKSLKPTEAVVAVEAVVATEAVAVALEVVNPFPFPLPFNKNRINANGCHGLAYNHGLFNQCSKKKLDTGNYCKNCQKESDQSGQPSCGTIEARVSEDLLEYTDPKGRKPIAYLKVLEKQKISVDTVKEFIMRENIEVESIHFECNEQKRGRPKTKIAKQVEAATVEDLFATLVNDDTVSLADTEIMTDSEDEGESAGTEAAAAEAIKAAAEAKKNELAAEKEARVSMRCEETEQKKCEKEAKAQQLAAEKEAKAQQLAAEKEAKLQQAAAEKEAKLQQAAAEKEAKQKEKEAKQKEKEAKAKQVAAEKEAKLKQAAAEKEAKLKQAAAQKEANKKLGKVEKKKAVKDTVVKAPKVEEEAAAAEEEQAVSVRAIIINGKKYLKSDSNMLYDPETQDEVGIYEPATNSIKALPDESDDELCEDEYESDN